MAYGGQADKEVEKMTTVIILTAAIGLLTAAIGLLTAILKLVLVILQIVRHFNKAS